jgi:hypothetical protein
MFCRRQVHQNRASEAGAENVEQLCGSLPTMQVSAAKVVVRGPHLAQDSL